MKQRADGRWVKKKIINGKPVFFYSLESTEKKAIKDIENQLIKYTQIAETKTLFKNVSKEWWCQHSQRIKYYTSDCYKSPLKDCNEVFGNMYIEDIKSGQINNFLLKLKAMGLAQQTIKLRHIVLNLIFDFAITKDYINNTPSRLCQPPKSKVTKREELSDIQQKKVIDSDCLLAKFLLYTGCRIGEALAVRYEDIKFKDNEIKISKEIIFKGNVPCIEETTKSQSGNRTIPLLEPLKKDLPKNKKGFIFNKDGKPLTKSQFRDIWESFCKDINEHITAHQFRHSFSTTMFYADVDLKTATAIMGHSKADFMLNKYTHLREAELSKSANKLNNIFTTK